MGTRTQGENNFGWGMAASEVVGAYSSMLQARHQAASMASAYQYQADMAEINAKMSESSAQQALSNGVKAQQSILMKTAVLKSRQKVAYASSGVDLSSQSVGNVQASTEIMGEQAKIDAETDSIANAWGFRTQGVSYGNSMRANQSGANSIDSGYAGTTALLGKASGIGRDWYFMKKAGAFD
jgi:hypothetical protein